MPRIFLCDNAPAYRRLLREVFRDEHDIEIVGEAADGCECVSVVPDVEPDVVLLDLDMPCMNGRQTLAKLQAVAPDTDVIVLTHDHPENSERDILALGAAGFIQKPLDPFSLPAKIRAQHAA